MWQNEAIISAIKELLTREARPFLPEELAATLSTPLPEVHSSLVFLLHAQMVRCVVQNDTTRYIISNDVIPCPCKAVPCTTPFSPVAMPDEWEHCSDLLEQAGKEAGRVDGDGYALVSQTLEVFDRLLSDAAPSACERATKLLLQALSMMWFHSYPHEDLIHQAQRLIVLATQYGAERNRLLLETACFLLLQRDTGYPPERVEALRTELITLLSEEGEPDNMVLLFISLLHFLRGEFVAMLGYHEQYSFQQFPLYPYYHSLFSLCASSAAMYVKQFHISYGIIESFRSTAELTGSNYLSLVWRIHLSFLLLHMNKQEEARIQIESAVHITRDHGIINLSCLFGRALALYHYQNGDFVRSRRILQEDVARAGKNSSVFLFTDPYVLDMITTLERQTGSSIPGYELETALLRAEQGACRQLRGVALRIRALQQQEKGQHAAHLSLLRESLAELQQTGNAQEIARTGHELVVALELQGEREASRAVRETLAQQFAVTCCQDAQIQPFREHLRCCLAQLAAIPLGAETGLQQLIGIVQREMGAQRAALFRKQSSELVCVCASNLTIVEIQGPDLKPVLTFLYDQLLQKIGSIMHHIKNTALGLALPVSEEIQWLLYMDNALGDSAFTDLSEQEITLFCSVLAAEIRGMLRLDVFRIKEQAALLPYDSTTTIHPVLSAGMAPVLKRAQQAATTDAPVLILGETGVGKELVARYVHENSGVTGAFIPVHLACIPEHLFESELFGHERGAFTGANRHKTGLVEMAHQGTLFLDEIGDVPPLLQTKLLRILQERRFRHVGGVQSLRSDFRLIAATNKDLWQEVREARFREDLLYRIAVIPLTIPPLRQRTEDILVLAQAFQQYYNKRYKKTTVPLSEEDTKKLLNHTWPGNIRELQSVIEQYVIFEMLYLPDVAPEDAAHSQNSLCSVLESFPTMQKLEERYIRLIMEKTNGKIYGQQGALELLGMKKSTLYKKIHEYAILYK